MLEPKGRIPAQGAKTGAKEHCHRRKVVHYQDLHPKTVPSVRGQAQRCLVRYMACLLGIVLSSEKPFPCWFSNTDRFPVKCKSLVDVLRVGSDWKCIVAETKSGEPVASPGKKWVVAANYTPKYGGPVERPFGTASYLCREGSWQDFRQLETPSWSGFCSMPDFAWPTGYWAAWRVAGVCLTPAGEQSRSGQ